VSTFGDAGIAHNMRSIARGLGSRQTDIRAYNERLLLSLVRRHGSLSKAELARLARLSPQAISVIMRKLEDDGLLTRGDVLRGKIGQPSTPMSLAADGALSLGLKIGRRSAEVVLINFVGEIKATFREPHAWPMPDALITFVRKSVAAIMAMLSPAERARISGLGIASPFELWNWEEEVGAPEGAMTIWRETDLVQALSAEMPFPVYLENDATAACGAEFIFGKGQEFASYLYLFIGFFIGGGLVLNGSLFFGATGNAGAIGSFPITKPDGKRGQLIDVASSLTLEARIKAAGLDPTLLWKEDDGWERFETFIDQWIAEIAPFLAEAIAATASIVDMNAAVIEGGFPTWVRARIVAATQKAMTALDLSGLAEPLIVEGQVGAHARAVGGACLPFFDKYILSSAPILSETA
jgi:predicted NBD/HSP70 family sugar kinase